MNPQLQSAIVQFIANEFQLDPGSIGPDTDFFDDLSLNPDQLSGLLQRMQDALNFILPEDKISGIITIGDLDKALTPETEAESPAKNS